MNDLFHLPPMLPLGVVSGLGSDRRRCDVRRLKSFLVASLDDGSIVRRCHVLNVSRVGAKLHMIDPPASGDRVTLILRDAALVSTVRWLLDDTIGIVFDTVQAPITLDDLLAPIPVPTPRPKQQPSAR